MKVKGIFNIVCNDVMFVSNRLFSTQHIEEGLTDEDDKRPRGKAFPSLGYFFQATTWTDSRLWGKVINVSTEGVWPIILKVEGCFDGPYNSLTGELWGYDNYWQLDEGYPSEVQTSLGQFANFSDLVKYRQVNDFMSYILPESIKPYELHLCPVIGKFNSIDCFGVEWTIEIIQSNQVTKYYKFIKKGLNPFYSWKKPPENKVVPVG